MQTTRETIEALGFEDIDTGGGCKAYYLLVADDCYILLTSAANEMTLPEDGDTDVDVGLYDSDSQPIRTMLAGSEYGGANVGIDELDAVVGNYRDIALGRMAPALLAIMKRLGPTAINCAPTDVWSDWQALLKRAEGRE